MCILFNFYQNEKLKLSLIISTLHSIIYIVANQMFISLYSVRIN